MDRLCDMSSSSKTMKLHKVKENMTQITNKSLATWIKVICDKRVK